MKEFLLKVVADKKVRVAFVSLVLAIAAAAGLNLSGCGGSLAQLQREGCYARAEADAQAALDAACPDAGIAECPARDVVLADLKAAQEACR